MNTVNNIMNHIIFVLFTNGRDVVTFQLIATHIVNRNDIKLPFITWSMNMRPSISNCQDVGHVCNSVL